MMSYPLRVIQAWLLLPTSGSALVLPALLATLALPPLSRAAQANPRLAQATPIESDLLEDDSLPQVTAVSELRDVSPADWAYSALESLIIRYGCIAGYPDGTYRGNTAMSRYEFAAGLNACLSQISALIETNLISQEDVQILQRLQDEFGAELSALRRRTTGLEERAALLGARQFSATTKLRGEVIFDISDRFGGEDVAFESPIEAADNTVFRDRVRLNLRTSFTGEDALVTRLAAGNVEPFSRPGPFDGIASTAEGSLAQRVGGNSDNEFEIDRLSYDFPVGDRLEVYISAVRGRHEDYLSSTFNDYLDDGDGGQGAISTFGQRSPIYRIGGGSGAALSVAITPDRALMLTGGYLADEAENPDGGSGLFNGDYAALGQLTFAPSDRLKLGVTYVHGYHTADNFIFDSGFGDEFFVGTAAASGSHIALGTPAVTNSYGLQAFFQPSAAFAISAFGGYTDAIFAGEGDGEIWYYGLGLSFPDLFEAGNLGGLVVGVEPYLGGESVAGFGLENDTSVHVEAFYRYQITDNIAITPGVVWITAPDQNDANDDFVVGTLRTTFRF
ncbi:MAG: iron uptake porin [Elainellaceae cyanobacterium]